ncbi:MAG: hypothetical protein AAF741_01775 [Bacteroidota bacterium]
MRYLPFLLLFTLYACAKDSNDIVEDKPPEGVALTSPDTDKTFFVWDFSEPKSYTYRTEMEMNMSMSSETELPMGNMDFNQVIGIDYRIEAKDNSKADIYIDNMNVIKAPFPGMEEMMAAQFPQGPTLIIKDMDAGGDYDPNQVVNLSGMEMAGAASPFMLPRRDLKVGETDTLVMEQSMSQDMVDTDFKQRVFITFAGYDEYKGKECAVLVLDFVVDESNLSFENPEDPDAEKTEIDMDIDMATGSRYYWDPVGHYFVGGEIQVDGDLGLGAGGGMPEMPEGVSMEMDMVQKIELVGIE